MKPVLKLPKVKFPSFKLPPLEVPTALRQRTTQIFLATLLVGFLGPLSYGTIQRRTSQTVVSPLPEGTVAGEVATPSAELASFPISSEATPSAELNQTATDETADTEEQVIGGTAPETPPTAYQAPGLGFPVNKFGIHAFATKEEIALAAELVNSNGGDWGWINFTFDINERGSAKWNDLFAYCKEKHLIPILQFSNHGNIPDDGLIIETAEFLSHLLWPTQKRFVTVFSEVNASEYWGWQINPEKYAHVLNKFIDELKSRNPNFFMMNGAFNASARTGHVFTDLGVATDYLSEPDFLARMNAAVPGILKKLDGWASHCYPHPAYRGHPLTQRVSGEADWEAGRNTMGSYKFEQRILRDQFGITGLPVFITETGWPHSEGATEHSEWHSASLVAEYYKMTFRDLYGPDPSVVAVTPFILKYDQYDNFAFIAADGSRFPQWDVIISLPKSAGAPPLN